VRSSGLASPRRCETATEAQCEVPICSPPATLTSLICTYGAYQMHGKISFAMYKSCWMQRHITMRATQAVASGHSGNQ